MKTIKVDAAGINDLVEEETLYLLSIPGMRESIREGMQTPVDECSDRLDW